MKTQINHPECWGMRSASYWITFTIAFGIIFIGIRFMLQPHTGAAGYGIAFSDVRDAAYGRIKGIRDIASGMVLLPLLFMRMRRAVAWVFMAAIVVPAADFLIVLASNGSADSVHLLIHGTTAAVMIVNSFFLFQFKSPSVQS